MTAPTWRSHTTPAGSTGTVSVALPAGHAANDILILCVTGEEADAAIATPAGWTRIGNVLNSGSGTTGSQLAVFWKRDSGSETDPLIVADSGDHTFATMHAIQGCAVSGSPVDTFAQDTDTSITSQFNIPTITTGQADCLVVFVGNHGIDALGAQFNSGYTYPTNIIAPNAKRADGSTDVSLGGGIAVWTGTMGAAGSIGGTLDAVVGAPTNTRQCRMTFSLIPAVAPISDSDSGTVTETEGPDNVSFGDSDSGTGTETEAITIPIVNSDSGVVTESEGIVAQTHHYYGDNFNRADESPLNISSSGAVWTNI